MTEEEEIKQDEAEIQWLVGKTIKAVTMKHQHHDTCEYYCTNIEEIFFTDGSKTEFYYDARICENTPAPPIKCNNCKDTKKVEWKDKEYDCIKCR